MNLLKKYKNIIFLFLIIFAIFGSTTVIDYAKSIAKSIENYFNKKSDYSNLSSQSYKYQSTIKSSSSQSSQKSTSSSNTSNNSIFSGSKKKTAQELDQEIMGNNTNQKDIRFNEEKLKRQMDDKKIHEEKFEMDFKELDDF